MIFEGKRRKDRVVSIGDRACQIHTQVSIKKLKQVHTTTHPAKLWSDGQSKEQMPLAFTGI